MSESGSKRAGNLSIEKQALLVLQMKKRRAAEAAAARAAAGIPRREASGRPPLSLAQQRLWLQDRLEPGTTAYNIPFHSRLRGPLDAASLAAAVASIVRRHESLRTRFVSLEGGDGEPAQEILPPGDFHLPIVDLSALPADARRRAEPELLADHFRPFDLARGPLFRAALARLSGEEHIFLVDMHHIVSDGWSFGVFFRELSALYGAFRGGPAAALPELRVQYADFAVWQRERLKGAVLEEQLGFWRGRLAGAPAVLELPHDRTRLAIQSHRGAQARLDLPADLVARLRDLALREGATPFMLHLAVFQLLLSRLSGQDDVVVGSPSAGRNRREIEGLIGLFLNTLVLRTDLSGDPTFRELLGRVKEGVLGAYQYQEVPFERLLEELNPERQLSHTPIFQVLFNFVSLSHLDLSLPGLAVEPIESAADSKFDFTLYVNELPDSLRLDLVYDADLFEPERMTEMLRQLQHLLRQAAAEPERAIGSYSLVTPGPSGSLSRLPDPGRTLNGTWFGPVHAALARAAAAHPERLAVEDATGTAWSYGELESETNRLARFLLAHGVERGDAVAIWAHRSAPLAQAVLGTFKAGAAMLILDPAYPSSRLLDYLRIGRPAAWIAVPGAPPPPPEVAEMAAGLCRSRLELGPPAEAVLREFPDTDPGVVVGQDDPACITFTSGSTGSPKGVVGRHGPLTHYYPWMSDHFALTAEDRFGVLSALSHDPLQRDLFTPIWLGASIVLPDPERIGAPGYLAGWLLDRAVTVVNLTPAMMELLLESANEAGQDDEKAGRIAELPALRRAFVVGDLLRKGNVRRLQDLAPSLLCFNLYGSTETQRSISFFPVPRVPDLDRLGKEVLPLGQGMEGCQLLVLNRSRRLAGVGEPGEIYVRSRHLAEGYLGDPALTAQRFLPNPLADHPAAEDRAYRTGDLGRYLPGGDVEMIGRADFQVKLRGFRIELGEVEAAIARHPEIRESVVVMREDRPGERRLVAYAVPAAAAAPASPTQRDLRDFLAAQVPDYMVPAAFVLLPALPLTATGKVDRRALPAPASEGVAETKAGALSPIEELLAGVWSDLLGVEEVAPEQSFFELGGHSLLATRMISRIRALFGVELPLRAIFLQPTLAGCAALVERAREGEAGLEAPPLVRRERDAANPAVPASFAQQRLWFLQQLEPSSVAYTMAGAARLGGPLDVAALAAAFGEVVRRHEAVRTVFVDRGGEPWQVINEPSPFRLPLIDLSALTGPGEGARADLAGRLARALAERPFDLERGPLLRASLLRLAPEEHTLVLDMHHIVSDGWSVGVLLREIERHYDAARMGGDSGAPPPRLPELPVQYADYALWQRRWLQGAELERQLAYWRGHLAGAPPLLELPTDRPRPPVQTFRGGIEILELRAESGAALRALGRRHGATLFMCGLAGFLAVLHRQTHQTDLLIGTPVAGRNREELETLIGFFVNTLILRTEVEGERTFGALLSRVREESLAALAHADLPFERLVEVLAPERSLSHTPLFQVTFSVIGETKLELRLEGIAYEPLALSVESAKFDLSATLIESADALTLVLDYNRDLFDPATARRLARHLSTLLAGAAADPATRLFDLPMLAPEERSALLLEWNDSERDAATGGAEVWTPLVHELFSAHALATPTAIAVEQAGRTLSYGDLEAWSNRMAHALRRLGAGPDVPVAICAPRTIERVAGTVAALKAGSPYVSLDPDYPSERLHTMVRSARAPILLTELRLLGRMPAGEGAATVLCLDDESWSSSFPTGSAPAVAVEPENLAFVIFTSGSTGEPKGVAIPHKGLTNMVRWHQRLFGTTAADRGTVTASPAFDPTVTEIWCFLAVGGSVSIADDETRLSPSLLLRWWSDRGVTLADLSTPMAELVLAEEVPADLELRVRGLTTGGDRLNRPPRPGTPFALVNLYGPAEVCVNSTGAIVPPRAAGEGGGFPSIGRPLDGTRVYVLDRDLQAVPEGVPGEAFIHGVGLARGYLNRPELTAERFLPDPWGALHGEPGARMYRTGDLVRWLANGELDFLGRADDQVKLRGMRVELGEIEAVLLRLPGVREAVVLARPGQGGEKRLVAYVAPPLPEEEVRAALKVQLPEHMIPSSFAWLEQLPLTPNQKIDRRALAAIEVSAEPKGEREAPRTALEEIVADLWAELLGGAPPGRQDGFFELGGHSLLATRMVSRVRSLLGLEIPLRAVFEQPTLAGFAAWIEREREDGSLSAPPPLVRVPRGEPLPASFSQRRLWFLQQLEPESFVYNLTGALRLEGPLDVAALGAALSALVARHESLRTTFLDREGEPWQVIGEPASLPFPLLDLSALPAERRPAETLRIAGTEAQRPYDLARGPLLRAGLVHHAEEEHALVLGMHHAISDGWSMSVFVRELGELYRAVREGADARLPELPVQFADFAAWQREWLSGAEMERQIAWWTDRLSGAPELLELPLDHPRPSVQSHRGHRVALPFGPELSAWLEAVAREQGVTLFMLLLAGFGALLSRYGGQSDVVIGSPIANRARAELEPVIGFFANTLALRVDLSGEPPFRALLARVRELALGAYAHQDVPFERLVDSLKTERSLSHSPIFQVVLALQNLPEADLELAGLAISPLEFESGRTHYDLSLFVAPLPADGGLEAHLYGASALFEPATTARILGHWRTLLAGAAGAVETPVAALPLLTAPERRQLESWDLAGRAGHPEGLLHGLFETRAVASPDRLALVADGVRLSYRELEERSGRLAARLRAEGAGPEVGVAVCLERSAELVVSLLAVLRSGSFYVPLDPRYPEERLRFLVEDSGAGIAVTLPHLAERLPAGLRIVSPEDLDPAGPVPPPPLVTAGHLAYLIYTSGSTGRPKAVAIEHRSATLFAHWARRAFSPEELRGVLASTAITFDLSVFELFVTLAWGGTVILAENALELPRAVETLPAGVEITLVNTVPSAMAELLREGALPPSVRTINLAGEALPRWLADLAYARPETARLCNLYGPSEDTTYSTWTEVERGSERAPTIGRPVDDTRAYVVDRGLERLPAGVPGELCLAGSGLARGYLGRPELTAERFLPDPFSREPGARMYRTGDLVRRLPDGALDYLGRLDHQVKIRGFRIELGEVEAALARQAGVQAAVVLAREDVPGDKRLVAYLAGAGLAPAEIRETLRRELPDPMVPSSIVVLEAFPLTPHGKVDRRALPAPEAERPGSLPAGPMNPIEEILAGVWSELLGLSSVAPGEGFFELGGHSLLATRLTSRVRALLGVELPVRAVFEDPTLAGMAARVQRARDEEAGAVPPPLVPLPPGEPAPASFSQQRLWFLQRLDPENISYNLTGAVRLEGRLDVAALAATLDAIVARHEVLRTTFVEREGEAWQVVSGTGGKPLPVFDLTGLAPETREREAFRLAAAFDRLPYDLTLGPLFRAALFRLGAAEHVLVVGMHHIVSDGWSMGILVRELTEIYGALLGRLPVPLPELPIQFGDFAAWQRRWQSGPVLESRLGWWSRHLGGAPQVVELPLDRPRPSFQSQVGHRESLTLSPELTGRLEASARRLGVTPFMLLLAGFGTLLFRHGSQSDLVIGTPIAGRERAELEDLIGFFVNTLALRLDLSGDPSFAELAARVREVSLGAYAHQDIPFERLVDELKVERSLSHTPVFQVTLALQNLPDSELHLPGLTLSPLSIEATRTQFDLSLFLSPLPQGGMRASLYAASELFEPATTRHLLARLERLLLGVVGNPATRLSQLPLLDAAERDEVLRRWNRTGFEVPETPVHRLFFAWAAQNPEALAVAWEGGSWSYGELAARARALASRLRAQGVGPERVVALRIGRSPELLAAVLGVLEAGGAYLPIDPAHPEARALWTVEDAEALLLLGPGDVAASVEPLSIGAGEAHPEAAPGADALAYVIYTSGSTGQPKGTELRHLGLSSLIAWHRSTYALSPSDRCTLLAGPGFDASVWETWAPLTAGASLHIPPPEVALSPAALVAWLAETGVSVAFLPTPLAEAVLAEPMSEGLALRALLTGGDRLKVRPAERLPFGLFNHYGPTESTVVATAGRVAAHGDRAPEIGLPIANTRVYLLDRSLEPVPLGVAGELCLAGLGLARGYRFRPELTARSFVPDPFTEAPGGGERLYRTGDLARRLANGQIEFVGRFDHQVKIRGFRIELGEIEAALAALPGVEACAVQVRTRNGVDRLAGYVVASPDLAPDADALRRGLEPRLPAYMIPSAFVFLPAFPIDANGKVDRRALPEPEPPAEAEMAAPRTPLEGDLARIWAEVLKLERVGIEDSFWDLGGHSLLATQAVSRLREQLGIEVALRALFEHPTISGLAAHIEGSRPAFREESVLPLVPRTVRAGEPLPLSFAQSRLWFLDQLEPGSLYNVPLGLRLEGKLDLVAFGAALAEIVGRHEALRTRFAKVGGEPVQILTPLEELSGTILACVDLSALPSERRADESRFWLEEEAQRPFDLARGPLYRFVAFRRGPLEHDLLLALHHIVSDGWSMGVLLREMGTLYAELLEGHKLRLPPLPVQYADFAVWQRERLQGETLAKEIEHWRRRLGPTSAVLDLPTDRPRPAVQSFRGDAVRWRLPRLLSSGIEAAARESRATPFILLMAAFQAALSRWSGQLSVNVGTPIAGRTRTEIEGLIGFFVNTLVIRTELAGDPSFAEIVRRVRDVTLDAHAHQELPFEKLVEALEPERSLSHSPLFQVMLVLQNNPMALTLPGLEITSIAAEGDSAKFDLLLALGDSGSGFEGSLEFASDLFDRTTAERMLQQLEILLEAALANPGIHLLDLPLLGEAFRFQVLREWNDSGAAAATLPQHERFSAMAALRPEGTAVTFRGERISYADLERSSNRLAHRLAELGVGRGTPVGICLERSLAVPMTLLAILKAGGVLLPLDPTYPEDRLAFMLADAKAPVLLSEGKLVKLFPEFHGTILRLEELAASLEGLPSEPPSVGVGMADLSYLIYTSGSTGKPKGTALHHGTLANLVAFHLENPNGAEGRTLQFSPLSFDVSMQELFSTWAAGATLVLISDEERRDPDLLLATLERERISRLFLPFVALHQLAEAAERKRTPLPHLKAVITAGEQLQSSPALVSWFRRLDGCILENHYGPSETHVVTVYRLPDDPGRWAPLPPIGRPIRGCVAYVLDTQRRPLPIGVPGELYLGGAQTARGYLGRPDLTAEKFLPDSISGEAGSRLYRTGDLARHLPDGRIEFLGRVDLQVKVRGFRIELGEVEAVLAEHPSVREAVVAAPEVDGLRRLVAYMIPDGEAPKPAALRVYLEERLPDYMVPRHFVILETLPLGATGKVDRKALPLPDGRREEGEDFVPPVTALEQLVAGIWAEVLKVDRVGLNDNFWDLGGHSLVATKVLARVNDALALDVPLRTLFKAPTVADFTLALGEALLEDEEDSET